MALLDQGGARMRQRSADQQARSWLNGMKPAVVEPPGYPIPGSTDKEIAIVPPVKDPNAWTVQKAAQLRVTVRETHDGEDCGCVDQTFHLSVGDTVELTHTCHDGRVDKVIATIEEVSTPPSVEHGSAEITRS